jgi:hypothetical protein
VSSHSEIEDGDDDDDEKKFLMKSSEEVVVEWISPWGCDAHF